MQDDLLLEHFCEPNKQVMITRIHLDHIDFHIIIICYNGNFRYHTVYIYMNQDATRTGSLTEFVVWAATICPNHTNTYRHIHASDYHR
jgi:uncharacterized protein YfaT (DUF1175 family)